MLQFNCIYFLKYITNFTVSDVTEQSSLRKVRVQEKICLVYVMLATASVVWWSEFLATDPEVPGSIPSPTRFSAK
jgi:hypothetical protein